MIARILFLLLFPVILAGQTYQFEYIKVADTFYPVEGEVKIMKESVRISDGLTWKYYNILADLGQDGITHGYHLESSGDWYLMMVAVSKDGVLIDVRCEDLGYRRQYFKAYE